MKRKVGTGRTAVVLGCALALGLALTGCAKGRTTTNSAAATSSAGSELTTYDVSVSKFKYSGMPDTIKSGPTLVAFSNHETFPIIHEMVVVGLPSGKSAQDVIDDAKQKGDKSEDDWLHFGEIGEVDTGATIAGVFSLPPGNYVLACWQTGTPEGKPEGGPVHATIGMIHQFTVTS
ncbi:MAG TPA: hypothetical protein VFA46_00495 [Actinomycetes bacterium]|jgi:uncharacterized cupredoxin-like copper-binding protein|nr:hypothetical protein [Actinomycetes bacterium]